MEYVIRDQEEKVEKTEVRLVKAGDKIVWRIGRWSIASLNPDGKVYLHLGTPKHNKEGIQIDEDGRIKLVE